MKDQEEEISRLLSSLKPVEASEGFEGEVRTRIAQGRKDTSISPAFWLALKFALPMVLLMLLGGFFVVSSDSVFNAEMVPAVSSSTHQVADLPADTDRPVIARPGDSDNSIAASSPNRNAVIAPSSPVQQEQDRDQDQAQSPDNSVVFPEGVDPRTAKIQNPRPPNERVSPLELLSFIGISGGCTPASCTVRSVDAGSIAERSGVMAGDVIRAIDDRPIDSLRANVTITRLSVLRNGETISIPLRAR